jgi:hypothetical protein
MLYDRILTEAKEKEQDDADDSMESDDDVVSKKPVQSASKKRTGEESSESGETEGPVPPKPVGDETEETPSDDEGLAPPETPSDDEGLAPPETPSDDKGLAPPETPSDDEGLAPPGEEDEEEDTEPSTLRSEQINDIKIIGVSLIKLKKILFNTPINLTIDAVTEKSNINRKINDVDNLYVVMLSGIKDLKDTLPEIIKKFYKVIEYIVKSIKSLKKRYGIKEQTFKRIVTRKDNGIQNKPPEEII